MESMGSKNGSSSPLCSTPVRERSSPFGDRNLSFINRSSSSETMKGTISSPTNEDVPSCMVSKNNKNWWYIEVSVLATLDLITCISIPVLLNLFRSYFKFTSESLNS